MIEKKFWSNIQVKKVMQKTVFFSFLVYSDISADAAALGGYLALELIYHHFFGAWIFPSRMQFVAVSSFLNGFAGLKLPFRSLVILILAHASYKFMQSILGLLNRQQIVPDATTGAIATMLLVWFPYYVNRPDDWNLWSFIALYSLLLLPTFTRGRKNIMPFVVASLIVLPLSVRQLTTAMIDTLHPAQWRIETQLTCAGGLILPKEFCAHLHDRAKTLQLLALQGSVGWSTSLPVLTDQTANVTDFFGQETSLVQQSKLAISPCL